MIVAGCTANESAVAITCTCTVLHSLDANHDDAWMCTYAPTTLHACLFFYIRIQYYPTVLWWHESLHAYVLNIYVRPIIFR